MRNLEAFIDKNRSKSHIKSRLNVKNSIFYCIIDDIVFGQEAIKKIINYILNIEKKFRNQKVSICIMLHSDNFKDKLSILFLECICYYLINFKKYKVKVAFSIRPNIWTEGVISSPLMILNTFDKANAEKFTGKFFFEIYQNHYRKLVKFDELKQNEEILSKVMTDIDNFLKMFSTSNDFREKIAEVIAELIGNAYEHGGTDCLVDIDVADDYISAEKEGNFYGINVAVINFSDKLVGSGISKIFFQETEQKGRYKELEDAYIFHRDYFDEKYTQEDFFNISAFQHKISGREENRVTGGTGLTKLIRALEEMSVTHKCYIVSGDRVIDFKKEYLIYDENNWIGFNKEGNFKTQLPDPDAIDSFKIFLPGVAYNLNFALRREEDRNEKSN